MEMVRPHRSRLPTANATLPYLPQPQILMRRHISHFPTCILMGSSSRCTVRVLLYTFDDRMVLSSDRDDFLRPWSLRRGTQVEKSCYQITSECPVDETQLNCTLRKLSNGERRKDAKQSSLAWQIAYGLYRPIK